MTKKSSEHFHTTYKNTGQLFRPYQVPSAVYTMISPLEIKPATTECRAKILPQSLQSTLHTSNAKSTSHDNCMVN